MDFSGIMQYISYLLVAIGVMAFVVSVVTQVVKSWPGLDKLPTSVVVIVLSLVCLLYTSSSSGACPGNGPSMTYWGERRCLYFWGRSSRK